MGLNAYFEFLFVLLITFALIYTLASLSQALKIRSRIKQTNIFLLSFSFGTVYVLFRSSFDLSYLWASGLLFLLFTIYLFIADKIEKCNIISRVIIDFILCTLTLSGSACLFSFINDIPLQDIIYERFPDGSYSFTPGYLDDIVIHSLSLSLLVVNFKYIHSYLLKKWESRQNTKIRDLQLGKKDLEIRFESLQAKVNPHFLYNSLNSIAGLATVDPEKTRQMALALSRFFRYSMNREQQMLITIKEEAEIIKTYLEIEKIRFGDTLNYSIQLPPEINFYKIPHMLLQPPVENSILHGRKNAGDSLNINISFSVNNQILNISIKDNGTPFPTDFIPGYGIKSIYDKLDLLFPGKYEVEIKHSDPKEFSIHIRQD
jgi:Putative regulator of cell autolysis